jgi:hypothetical protein
MTAAPAGGGLFPLPFLPLPHRPRRLRRPSRRIEQRYRRALLKVRLANQAVSALNSLSVSFFDLPDTQPGTQHSTSSAAQNRMLAHVVTCVARFAAGRPEAASDPSASECGEHVSSDLLSLVLSGVQRQLQRPHGLSRLSQQHPPGSAADSVAQSAFLHDASSSSYPAATSTAVPIIADRVSLPAAAGTASLLDLLPPDVANRYRHSACNSLLAKSSNTKRTAPPRPRLFASAAEYRGLIRRMVGANMLAFTRQPLVVNGIFGVRKGPDSIRLIIDARAANAVFVEPPKVTLPTPDLLVRLQSDASQPLFVGKRDLDNFYHRLALPEWLRPYFALPPLRAADISGELAAQHGADTLVWPCCTTLPMGWSHSVYLAQCAHEHILNTATPFCPADRITPANDFRLDRTRHGLYIDDLVVISPSRDEANRHLAIYDAAVAARRLPASTKPDKRIDPTTEPVDAIGLALNGAAHSIGLAPAKLWRLTSYTMAMLRLDSCTGYDLRRLVGRWIWACLPVRPALSVLNASFRFMECAGYRSFSIWRSVRTELVTLVNLAPLLIAQLSAPWFSRVVATDASDVGCGVVASLAAPHAAQARLARLAGVPPSEQPDSELLTLATAPVWRTIVSSPWRIPEHINVLELRSVMVALRWALSFPSSVRHRLLVLSDSSVAVGALSKGRSSSPTLLRRLRTVAAMVLASGLALSVAWLPTAANPADGPSRAIF